MTQGRFGVRQYVAPVSSSPIITNGLILNLDAGNIASYPGTGTVWTDLSSSGNNGVLLNGTSYSSANGGSLVFDGINDKVSLSSNMNIGKVFTANVWVKINSYNCMILGGQDYITYGYLFYMGSSLTIYASAGEGTYTASPDMNLSTNTWVNLSIVRNLNSYKWYKNGQLIGTSSDTSNSGKNYYNNYLSTIGSNNGGQYPFNGSISNIQIYNTLLSDADITTNFNALKGRFGL